MQRIFNLSQDDQGQVLTMSTHLEDEFGEVTLMTSAHLDGPSIVQTQISSGSISMDIRIQEMYHFLSILKLFDPHFNTKKDGLPQIVSQTPPEPWETE